MNRGRRHGHRGLAAEPGPRDGIQDFAAVPDDRDAEVLQVLRCQVGEDRLVYFILAECPAIRVSMNFAGRGRYGSSVGRRRNIRGGGNDQVEVRTSAISRFMTKTLSGATGGRAEG
jgi:hypothetical protein